MNIISKIFNYVSESYTHCFIFASCFVVIWALCYTYAASCNFKRGVLVTILSFALMLAAGSVSISTTFTLFTKDVKQERVEMAKRSKEAVTNALGGPEQLELVVSGMRDAGFTMDDIINPRKSILETEDKIVDLFDQMQKIEK